MVIRNKTIYKVKWGISDNFHYDPFYCVVSITKKKIFVASGVKIYCY